MTPAIEQSATFKTTPAELYRLFMDSAKHAAATGAPAKISRKVGGKWSAFGGMILGKNLALVPNRMIVQSWRSSAWKSADPDSVLVVHFEKTKGGATVYLSHVGVPHYDHQGVTEGWRNYYWKMWDEYFRARNGRNELLPEIHRLIQFLIERTHAIRAGQFDFRGAGVSPAFF